MLKVDIRKSFHEFQIDASFKSDAPLLALFGPSGAGKSTILSMVAGLAQPDQGNISFNDIIFFDGRSGLSLPAEKRRLGVVFQDAHLFPHLSVAKNVTYARWAGRRRNAIAFDHVVDILGLEHLLIRKPVSLSGGEKQRVSIARALLSDPQMLLLDEPFSSLDLARRSELRGFLKRVGEEFGVPMLLVSHDLDDIVTLSDDLVLVNAGKVLDQGKMPDVFSGDVMHSMIGLHDDSAVLVGHVYAYEDEFELASFRIEGDDEGQFPIRLIHSRILQNVSKNLRIFSKDVALATEIPQHTSLQNCLPVRIRQIEDLANGQVRVTCECFSRPIFARITRKSHIALDLQEGQHAYALLKSVALI